MFHVKQFIKNPIHRLLFYLFLFLLPIQTRVIYNSGSAYIGWYFNYHLAFFVYLSDLILVSCFISWIIFERPKIRLDRIFWLILAFFTLILASLFRVKHPDLGLYQGIKWLELLLLVTYIRETFRETCQFHIAAYTIAIGGLLQSILALWQFHVQHMLGFTWLGEYIPPMGVSGLATINTVSGKIIRAYGTFPHPNVLGAFLVLGLLMGFFLVSRETNDKSHPRESGDPRNGPRIKSAVVAFGLFITTLGIFLTFSRLAWLTAAIVYLTFGIYGVLQKQWSRIIVIVIVALVSCGTIWFGYHSDLRARVSDGDPRAVNDRIFFNDLGLKLVSQHPTLGVGVGNYVPALQSLVKLPDWQYQPAHNIFIFTAAESGIAALAIFLYLLIEIFWRAWQTPNHVLKFSLLLLGLLFLALGQFDHYFVTIQQGRLMLFTVLGLLSALPNIQHEISNDQFSISNK